MRVYGSGSLQRRELDTEHMSEVDEDHHNNASESDHGGDQNDEDSAA
jgi:hypothetical protein